MTREMVSGYEGPSFVLILMLRVSLFKIRAEECVRHLGDNCTSLGELRKNLEELKIRREIECIQIIVLLKTGRILRKMRDY